MIALELLKIELRERNNFVYSQIMFLLRQIGVLKQVVKKKYYEKKFYPKLI